METSNNLSSFTTKDITQVLLNMENIVAFPFEPFWLFGDRQDLSAIADAILEAQYEVKDLATGVVSTADKFVDLPDILASAASDVTLEITMHYYYGDPISPKELIFQASKIGGELTIGIPFDTIIGVETTVKKFFEGVASLSNLCNLFIPHPIVREVSVFSTGAANFFYLLEICTKYAKEVAVNTFAEVVTYKAVSEIYLSGLGFNTIYNDSSQLNKPLYLNLDNVEGGTISYQNIQDYLLYSGCIEYIKNHSDTEVIITANGEKYEVYMLDEYFRELLERGFIGDQTTYVWSNLLRRSNPDIVDLNQRISYDRVFHLNITSIPQSSFLLVKEGEILHFPMQGIKYAANLIYADSDKEYIIKGLSGGDTIYGNCNNDILYGNDGKNLPNDLIEYIDKTPVPCGDDDILVGGGGKDTIKGDTGEDTIYGDYKYYLGDSVSDAITLYEDYDGGDFRAFSELWGVKDDQDNISGGDGNDVIVGGGEGDKIKGGKGEDTIYGDYEYSIEDSESSNWNDEIYGEQGNDTIYGGEGNDTINGGAGNDYILAGTGNDTLTDMSGSDLYTFSQGDGIDVITDLDSTLEDIDTIDFAEGIDKEDIAVFMDNNDLVIGYGSDDQIVVKNQAEEVYGVEMLQLADGDFITAEDINMIVQEMTAFANTEGFAITSVGQVQANPDLMNIVMNGWS